MAREESKGYNRCNLPVSLGHATHLTMGIRPPGFGILTFDTPKDEDDIPRVSADPRRRVGGRSCRLSIRLRQAATRQQAEPPNRRTCDWTGATMAGMITLDRSLEAPAPVSGLVPKSEALPLSTSCIDRLQVRWLPPSPVGRRQDQALGQLSEQLAGPTAGFELSSEIEHTEGRSSGMVCRVPHPAG
jgi:hypothetical protein